MSKIDDSQHAGHSQGSAHTAGRVLRSLAHIGITRNPGLIARLRNRVETSFKEITYQMELARHDAHTFEGLLTRTVAVLAART
jgi:hypothetical protein